MALIKHETYMPPTTLEKRWLKALLLDPRIDRFNLLSALKDKRALRVLYPLKNGSEKWMTCNPIRLEYSLCDDEFRLISASKSRVNTINLAKIIQCEIGETFEEVEVKELLHDKRTVELLLKDERQALESCWSGEFYKTNKK